MPDIAKTRAIKGEVVAVGRGKWHPGEWWYCKDGEPIDEFQPYCWQWIEGYLEPPPVFAGQTVFFNSRWSDMGDEYQHPGVGWDETLHMVQIGDIFAVIN